MAGTPADGAEPGAHVWVTGSLGASAAAVATWNAGEEPSEALRSAFVRPIARVQEARCLVEQEVVDAMIDVSDGLVGDVGHIAAASGMKVTLELSKIPVADAAIGRLGKNDALQAALTGGEDYELCFVTDPDIVDRAHFLDVYGVTVTRVGSVSEGEGRLAPGGGRDRDACGRRRLRPLGRRMIRLLGVLLWIVPATSWFGRTHDLGGVSWLTRCASASAGKARVGGPVSFSGSRAWTVVIENLDVIDSERPQILVANHSSWYDVLVLLSVPGTSLFVAKKELSRVPIFGRAIGGCGHIFIDRQDRNAAVQSLPGHGNCWRRRVQPSSCSRKERVRGPVSFSGSRKVRSFLRSRPASRSCRAAIIGSRDVMRKGSLRIRPGTITLRFGAPIPVEGLGMDDRNN